ncbi:MAG: hypothetical protein QM569_09755 [Acidovorax sp.]|uniref:helix-turn-helix transcriptional regulator n=1 Tax=Acidovorax sp. TaxID=1872122 RepID=UPI0039E3027F
MKPQTLHPDPRISAYPPDLLRPATAAARYDLSRRTLSRLARSDPGFPQPIRVSKRLVLFRRSDLDAYFSSKQAHALNTEDAIHA